MDLPIMLLGVLLGLLLAVKAMAKNSDGKTLQTSNSRPSGGLQPTPPQLPSPPQYALPNSFTFPQWHDSVGDILRDAAREADIRRGIPRPSPYAQAANNAFNSRNILESWRKSVVGLIKLAESNLQIAKAQVAMSNHKASAEGAVTSVENVSRALLHCFGEKPDVDTGQEEPLRLLVRRLQGEEKVRFESAIDEVVRLYRNKSVQSYLSEKNIQAPLLNGAKTQQILETATKIVNEFKQIIDEHFATEIPELRERCPKCGAINITLWTFGSGGSTYQCYVCSHKWIQPTQ